MASVIRWGFVTVDAADPAGLAAFWSAVLERPVEGSWRQFTWLAAPDGGPKLAFQQVDDDRVGKNRVHLDLGAADIDAAAARLESLGATALRVVEEGELRWIVMADPEGNELCVMQAAQDLGSGTPADG
jgi:predicted enzyme related to lactoylglutathione lyase